LIAYFDTSALAKRYVAEVGSERVQAWLGAPVLATSRWTHVELLSAMSRRCREGLLRIDQRNQIAATLVDDLAGFIVMEVDPGVIAIADGLLVRHALSAGDAVQLASALALRQWTGQAVAFLGFDNRLKAAATREGLALELA
jgi:hypothetical protein